MQTLLGRRRLLQGMGGALVLGGLDGCARDGRPANGRPAAGQLKLAPILAQTDGITRITVCTRPFRAQGPQLDAEGVGNKTVVHNDGHGGSGWSQSWGSSGIAVAEALATGERNDFTIYAKELPPIWCHCAKRR